MEPQARSSSGATGGRTPPRGVPGVPPLAPFAFFLAFLGPEEKKQNLRKQGKVFSGKEKTSRNGKKKQTTKKTSPKQVRPRPRRSGAKCGEMWGRSTPENGRFGGFGAQHALPAQFGQRNGDFGSDSRPRRKTQTGISGHGRVPVAKLGWKETFGAQNGFRSGLIPRPRHTQRGQKRGFGVRHAIRAQNEARNGDLGPTGAKRARKGLLGVQRAPPAQN